jgi:hypothetical protein
MNAVRTKAPGGLSHRPAVKPRLADDRGDVPGWVLITLMTAGLVVLLWTIAGPALESVFEQAISRVTAF